MWGKFFYRLLITFFSVTFFLSALLLIGELYLKSTYFTFSFLILFLGSLLPTLLFYTIPVGFFYSLSYHVFIINHFERIFLFDSLARLRRQWKYFIGFYSLFSFFFYLFIIGWAGPVMQQKTLSLLQSPSTFLTVYPSQKMIFMNSGISLFFKEKSKRFCKHLFLAFDQCSQTNLLLSAEKGEFKEQYLGLYGVDGLVQNESNAFLLRFFVKEISVVYEKEDSINKSSLFTFSQLYKSSSSTAYFEFYKRIAALFFFMLLPFLAWKTGFYVAKKEQSLSFLLFFSLLLLLGLYFVLNLFF